MQMLNKVLGWSVASVVLAWAAVDRVCRCKSRTIECERHRREAVANELLSKKISNKNRTCVPTGSRRSRNRRARCWLLLFWFRYSLYATHATAAASVFYRSRTTCMRLFGATKAWRAKTWQWSEWRANPIFFFFLFQPVKKKREKTIAVFSYACGCAVYAWLDSTIFHVNLSNLIISCQCILGEFNAIDEPIDAVEPQPRGWFEWIVLCCHFGRGAFPNRDVFANFPSKTFDKKRSNNHFQCARLCSRALHPFINNQLYSDLFLIFSPLNRNEKRWNRRVQLLCFVFEIHFFNKLILWCFLFLLMISSVHVRPMCGCVCERQFFLHWPIEIAKNGKNYAAKWKVCGGNEKGTITSWNRNADFSVLCTNWCWARATIHLLLTGQCDRIDGAFPCGKYFHWNFGNCVRLFSAGGSASYQIAVRKW